MNELSPLAVLDAEIAVLRDRLEKHVTKMHRRAALGKCCVTLEHIEDWFKHRLERLVAARADAAELMEAVKALRFDVFELTTQELRAAFDDQTRVAVVQIDTANRLTAALARFNGEPRT